MDRDEFMELVYETFADEPDNVLANGIIEAADAYAEHEKAQLSQEGATSDMISRTETVEHLRRVLGATVPNTEYDEGYIDGIEFGINTVSTLPTIQPVATDTNVGNNSEIPNSSDAISRQAAIDGKISIQRANGVEIYSDEAVPVEYLKSLPPAQPEPKEGCWIRRGCGLDVECKCSVCGYKDFVSPHDTYWFKRNYCPNCGVRMKGATP